uniref:EGF-like domain-containing protein n=1 Tax=Phaeomonas parva TaxID=124430 RepID=A0A7S1U7T1_9STRA|mmetsp:Transcript_35415/g.111441  ORF Transcript_35415/g.111441 Transcript_35415/m.111441 type:complete len:377 (+) Transcript_35415:2-1132(+)
MEGLTGTPMPPYAATGPRQYVRPFVITVNGTHNATVYEWCTSVKGQPTRGKVVDGLYGRADEHVFIPQPRRQAPGWDGCRDRIDNRSDLPAELQWVAPNHRSTHKAIFSKDFNMIIVYGGLGTNVTIDKSLSEPFPAEALSDMWQFGLNDCLGNCSNHGDCSLGFCTCHPGYYGSDCSNTSCPGDFCWYDDFTRQQHCRHCCHAGFDHDANADNFDIDYVQEKKTCSAEDPGIMNGICDGFGQCQCAPPFIGDDCSIKDCPNRCSYNGWCSVEFPVSRCICNPGYYGEYCQFMECLNNCSWPNGVCDIDTGLCDCRMTYNPYNRTLERLEYGGEDCSYIPAYAAAPALRHDRLLAIVLGLLVLAVSSLFAYDERTR